LLAPHRRLSLLLLSEKFLRHCSLRLGLDQQKLLLLPQHMLPQNLLLLLGMLLLLLVCALHRRHLLLPLQLLPFFVLVVPLCCCFMCLLLRSNVFFPFLLPRTLVPSTVPLAYFLALHVLSRASQLFGHFPELLRRDFILAISVDRAARRALRFELVFQAPVAKQAQLVSTFAREKI
jgi:hypothetical protein